MMTLVFTVLCLGPRIFWSTSEYVTYSWLYHFVTLATPYMSGLDEPFEFVVIASFFSTVSVGIVLQHIWQKSNTVAGTIGLLLLSLHFWGNPAPTPVKITKVPYHKFYTQQATAKHEYSILDFPPKRQGTALFPGEYFYFQSIHQNRFPMQWMPAGYEKILFGWNCRMPFRDMKPHPFLTNFWGPVEQVQREGVAMSNA